MSRRGLPRLGEIVQEQRLAHARREVARQLASLSAVFADEPPVGTHPDATVTSIDAAAVHDPDAREVVVLRWVAKLLGAP